MSEQSEMPLENRDRKTCDLPLLGFGASEVSYFNQFSYKCHRYCHRYCLVIEMQEFSHQEAG